MRFTTRPEIRGTFGAVASTHWLASAVGMATLERGGNAFDAAVAAGFVLQVVEPHLNGPAGEVPILCAPAKSEAPWVICGQGPVPAAATIPHFRSLGLNLIPGSGLLAACIPGAFGAWLTLLMEFGTMRLRDVLEPAISYAVRGYPLVENIAVTIASVESLFKAEWPSSARIYLPNGEVPKPGNLFTNPALGRLYGRVLAYAEKRAGREAQIRAALKYWYSGEVAERIDAFCRNPPVVTSAGDKQLGLLTGADMAAWQVPIERPVWVDWTNYRIFKCGPWSQGPVLLQALRLLAPMNLGNLEPTEPEFIHLIVEALKLAMADRDAWYGDAGDAVPLEALLSTSYADERRCLVRDVASQRIEPGSPGGFKPARVPLIRSGSQARLPSRGEGEPTLGQRQSHPADIPETAVLGDTCHVDAVDRWGNLVAATPSGGWLQSSPAIPGLGFALTTRAQMCWLTEGMNSSLTPGRRPRTTLTPTLVYRDGSPYLAYGTPGGDQQDQWSLLILIYHLLHDMNLQEAIDMPAFHTDHLAASFWPRETVLGSLTLEGRYPEGTVAELIRKGHHVVVGAPWSEGRLSACGIDTSGKRRVVKAAANPRGMQGYAVGR